nr:glycine-rich protein 23-like [Arachis hypogaea]
MVRDGLGGVSGRGCLLCWVRVKDGGKGKKKGGEGLWVVVVVGAVMGGGAVVGARVGEVAEGGLVRRKGGEGREERGEGGGSVWVVAAVLGGRGGLAGGGGGRGKGSAEGEGKMVTRRGRISRRWVK